MHVSMHTYIEPQYPEHFWIHVVVPEVINCYLPVSQKATHPHIGTHPKENLKVQRSPVPACLSQFRKGWSNRLSLFLLSCWSDLVL